jgi:hypothetical protein
MVGAPEGRLWKGSAEREKEGGCDARIIIFRHNDSDNRTDEINYSNLNRCGSTVFVDYDLAQTHRAA